MSLFAVQLFNSNRLCFSIWLRNVSRYKCWIRIKIAHGDGNRLLSDRFRNQYVVTSELSGSKSHTSTLMAFCSFPSKFVAVHELSKLMQIVIINQAVFTEAFVSSEPAIK